jgi:hypothetical protein
MALENAHTPVIISACDAITSIDWGRVLVNRSLRPFCGQNGHLADIAE